MIHPRVCFCSKIAALINVYLIMKPEMTQCRAADRMRLGFALELPGIGNLERLGMRVRLEQERHGPVSASEMILTAAGRMSWKEGPVHEAQHKVPACAGTVGCALRPRIAKPQGDGCSFPSL